MFRTALDANISIAALIMSTTCNSAVAQSTTVVNVADYLMQSSGGEALCSPTPQGGLDCIHATFNEYGEVRLATEVNGSITGTDFVARSTGGGANGGQYFGVIRSIDATVSSTDKAEYLRCFSTAGTTCTPPSDANDMPQALPQYLKLNVVSQQDDLNASYADGSAKTQIAGDTPITGSTTFEVVGEDPSTCAQTLYGVVHNQVFASYEWNAQFGGSIGTTGALVVEEVEYEADGVTPNHIERYYYVNGYGRVRAVNGFWSTTSHQYQKGENQNLNTLYPVSQVMPSEPPNYCAQGTASYSTSN